MELARFAIPLGGVDMENVGGRSHRGGSQYILREDLARARGMGDNHPYHSGQASNDKIGQLRNVNKSAIRTGCTCGSQFS